MEAIDAAIEVNRIFKVNEWYKKDIHEFAFNGLCKLCELLNPDQRKLIIELTQNYHWLTQSDYQNKFIEAIEKADPVELEQVNKIYFFPIKRPEDEHKIKSGEEILYMVKSYKRLMIKYAHIKFEILKEFDMLSEQNLQLKNDERLYLIDDYLGSGQTFDYCMFEVAKNPSLISTLIKVVCIAIQEETLLKLNEDGFRVLTSLVLKRGITDFYSSPIMEQKKQLMRDIERNVLGSKPFTLGYNETEALITMMRTPDNTFPVFWRRFKKNGKTVEAPFAREEENYHE